MRKPLISFQCFVQVYREAPKKKLLELFKNAPDLDFLSSLDREDLLLEYGERYTAVVIEKGKKDEGENE